MLFEWKIKNKANQAYDTDLVIGPWSPSKELYRKKYGDSSTTCLVILEIIKVHTFNIEKSSIIFEHESKSKFFEQVTN